MRLAQLARKLDIPKKNIINYLDSKGISIELHGNTKVDEEHEKLVLAHFGHQENIKDAKSKNPQPIQDKKQEADLKEKTSVTEIENPKVAEDTDKGQAGDKAEEKKVEVIRPKKIQLQGIKVLGKIDLPEPPQKEEIEEKEHVEPEESKEVSPKKYIRKKESKKPFKSRSRKAPRRELTYEEKIKKEERERLKKELQQQKELKEKKRRHYEKKVQTKLQTEKKKKKQQDTKTSTERPKKEIIKHNNPLKRFWAWLNGEYDKF